MTNDLAAKIALLEANRALFGDAETDRLIAALHENQPQTSSMLPQPPVTMTVEAIQNSSITDVTMIHAETYYAAAPDATTIAAQQALRRYLQRLAGDCSVLPLGQLDPTDASDQGMALAQVYITLHVQDQDSDADERVSATTASVIAAINQAQVTMLLGTPGSGKSTVINYFSACLAHAWLDNNQAILPTMLPEWKHGLRVPVRLMVRDWATFLAQRPNHTDPLVDLSDYVNHICSRWQCEAATSLLWSMLHDGSAILIVDGLDEVVGTPLSRIMHSLRIASTTWSTTHMIVSCRMLDYQEEPTRQIPQALVRILAPLTDGQIHMFVQAWYTEYARQHGIPLTLQTERQQSLQQAIQTRPALAQLATSPLLLTIMAIVHAGHGALPESEAMLYKACIEVLLLRWRQTNSSSSDLLERLAIPGFGRKQLFNAIARVGFLAHEQAQGASTTNNPADLTKMQILDSFGESLSGYIRIDQERDTAALTMLYALTKGNGLLLQHGPQVFAFPHRTFQEFLAGYYLAGLVNKKPLVYARAAHLHWHNSLRLMVSYCVQETNDLDFPEEIIRGLLERDSFSQVLAGELLAIIGHGQLAHYYADATSATTLWQKTASTMLQLATTSDSSHAPTSQRIRAGLTHGRLAFGETSHLATNELLVHVIDQRLPLAYLQTAYQNEAWWPAALDDYWCHCEAGTFWFGNDRKGKLVQQTVSADFAIGRYPVTNAEYARFLNAADYLDARWWTPEAQNNQLNRPAVRPSTWSKPQFNAPNQPVVGISWYEAMAYCAWLSVQLGYTVRLATALEWEGAARHTDRRRYPWGDSPPTPEYANYRETALGYPAPIGCFPKGQAVSGSTDMVGNVSEWLATLADTPTAKQPLTDAPTNVRILRSYSDFSDPATDLNCGSRSKAYPNARYSNLGFRLCLPDTLQTIRKSRSLEYPIAKPDQP